MIKLYKQSGARSAFTLIELVITIALLAITAGITIQYLVSASRLYTLLLAQKQADGEIADAVSRMRREVRLHVQTIAADSNQWTFSNTCNAINTTISRSGADLNLNTNRLATGIDRFTLNYYDATNGPTSNGFPFPLSVTNYALIRRVALDIRTTNDFSSSGLQVNFFLQNDLLK